MNMYLLFVLSVSEHYNEQKSVSYIGTMFMGSQKSTRWWIHYTLYYKMLV